MGIILYSFRPGTLIECDESIKAMIVKIDAENDHDFIIDNIDDKHALIKTARHEELKELLKQVCCAHYSLLVLLD